MLRLTSRLLLGLSLSLLGLAILIVGWIAFLWYGVHLNLDHWAHDEALLVHFLPPVTVWLAWQTRRFVKYCNKLEEADRKKADDAKKQAEEEATRAKQEQTLAQQRFGCDCRIISIGDFALFQPEEITALHNISITTIKPEEKTTSPAPQSVLDTLTPAITQALRGVYEKYGAAAIFPIHVAPPANASVVDVIKHIKAIHKTLITDMALPIKLSENEPQIYHIPFNNSIADCLIGLFESTPDLPGTVVLAFDSPQTAKPGHGAFALLLTHADLNARLQAIPDDANASTPIPNSNLGNLGKLVPLAHLPKHLRDQLTTMKPVARIHRAAEGERNEGRILDMERALKPLLEHAQINAGLTDAPSPRCEWLVHNAGDTKQAGNRVASISNALMHFDIELNPLDMATDMARTAGDLGKATPVAMLAIALAQAHLKEAPVLCAEYSEPGRVAVAFAMPAIAA